MLASSAPEPFDSGSHIFEVLWDGLRAILTVDGGGVRVQDRYGSDVTASYPELQSAARQVRGVATLDGVIVALDGEGMPDFGRLRTRLRATHDLEARKAAEASPVTFHAFDVLYAGGQAVMDWALRRRKELLAQLVRPRGALTVPSFIPGDGMAFFEAARQHGLEGIIAKEWNSRYTPGQRARSWLKVKVYQKREFVIGGFTYGGRWKRGGRGGRGGPGSPFSSLLLGAFDEGGVLRYAGEVSGGFNDDDMRETSYLLDQLLTGHCPFQPEPELGRLVFWCRPQLCATVRYSEWRPGGRLLFPVFEGPRTDIPARACRLEPEA